MMHGQTAPIHLFDLEETPVDFYSFAPIAAVLDAAYTVVTALAEALSPFAGAAGAALAVVLITLLVRAALVPVGASQVRAEFTRRRLAPQLAELQRRYKKNPELLQEKTMQLYRDEKASPFAGMMPTLLQAPVLSIVYGLFILASINGHANALISARLFGVPLGDSLAATLGAGAFGPGLIVFAGVLLVIATVAWLSRRVGLRFAASAPPVAPAPAGASSAAADAAPGLQRITAALSWLPFITVIFAGVVPLAAALYLTVSTAWTLGERVVLRRALAPRERPELRA